MLRLKGGYGIAQALLVAQAGKQQAALARKHGLQQHQGRRVRMGGRHGFEDLQEMGLIAARQIQAERSVLAPVGRGHGQAFPFRRGQALGEGQHGLAVKAACHGKHPRLAGLTGPESLHVFAVKASRLRGVPQAVKAIGLSAGIEEGIQLGEHIGQRIGPSAGGWRISCYPPHGAVPWFRTRLASTSPSALKYSALKREGPVREMPKVCRPALAAMEAARSAK